MNLINELREKSANAENTKSEVIAEIKNYFDKYLNSDRLEEYLRHWIRSDHIKERKVPLFVEFWAHHDGCSTTHFHCGGGNWYNPENKDGHKSWYYKGIELRTIDNEVGEYLSSRLMNRMNELGFYTISKEKQKSSLDYYEMKIYFGW